MKRPWLIFTDLDGTLLDARDFSFGPVLPTLRRLHEREVTIVPVTSKTLAEVIPLTEELGIAGPLIVESGAAIARRDGAGWSVEGRGIAAARIEELVPEIERRSGARLKLFSRMSEADAVRESGLHGGDLDRARRRQFDVPFTTVSPIAAIAIAARPLGISVQTGGRFHHLCGCRGKAEAVREIVVETARRLERTPFVIALGDSAMDAEFVAYADVRVAVPRPDGSVDSVLAAIPLVRIAPRPGPEGWAAVIDALLDEEEAPA